MPVITTKPLYISQTIRSTVSVKIPVVVGSPGGNVIIEDQDANTIATIPAPGTYTVEVLTEIVDTIDSNTATIIDPIA